MANALKKIIGAVGTGLRTFGGVEESFQKRTLERQKQSEAFDRAAKVGKILGESDDPNQRRIGEALQNKELLLEDLSGNIGKVLLGTQTPLEQFLGGIEIGEGGAVRLRTGGINRVQGIAAPARLEGTLAREDLSLRGAVQQKDILGREVPREPVDEGIELEDVTIREGGITGKIPKSEQQLNREILQLADEKFISAIATKSIDRLFKSQEQKTNFTKVIGLMSRLISQVKGAGEEQRGLGLIPGAIGSVGVFFKNDAFGRTSALPGQITEATFALNSILTGQNRVIKGITEKIAGTLLSRFDPGTFIASKTTQTIRNSYILSKAIEKTGVTPEQLKGLKGRIITFGGKEVEEIDLSELGIDIDKVITSITLSKKEEEELNAIVKVVLGSPATKPEELPGFESGLTQNIEQELQQFDSVKEANAANLPTGTPVMVVNPSTGRLQRAVIE